MKIELDPAALKSTPWHQFVLRFVLGGLVTVACGLIAKQCGPVFGGLFLAFPAILPASVTLIASRERNKKSDKGLHGEIRARRAAALDAAGAVLGSIALIVFALIAWRGLLSYSPAAVLGSAAITWFILSMVLWWIRKKHVWTRHLRTHPREG